MMKCNDESGTFKVLCDEALYGAAEIELDYNLFQNEAEDFSNWLLFVWEHYKEMYQQVLISVLTAYQRYPKWDIWDEETKTFSRIALRKEEEVHKYIGVPTIGIMSHEDQILTGLSFWKKNKMSIEHGFCAIFEGCELLLIGDSDFCNIVNYWDYRDDFNILKV